MTAGESSNEAGRPPRLRRLERIFERFPIYFVTASTAGRKPLLANVEVHAAFVKFAGSAMDRGAWVGRYVLMPDHIHLFVAIDDERIALSDWMKSLKNAFSKTLRAGKEEPPHWQKGFFDHVLRSSESYSEKWEYVRLNPVRARLVMRAEDWPYQGEISALDVRRS